MKVSQKHPESATLLKKAYAFQFFVKRGGHRMKKAALLGLFTCQMLRRW
jgi:hypothetical protein